MTAAAGESAETENFRLSNFLAVDITVGPGGMVCEWTPSKPRKLTRQETRAFYRARDKMLVRLSHMIGGQVAMLNGDGTLDVFG